MILDPNLISELSTILGTALFTLVVTLLGIRRRASRDKAEITKDRAEESVITHLEKQRDKATTERDELYARLRAADNEKSDALNRVLKLTSEVEHLSGQIKILKNLVEGLGSSLDQTKKELHKYMEENATLIERLRVLEMINRRDV